eukprot:CAMPEP_0182420442 /NCGR_PEP_ID=MMETSP1167-20130531/5244_1 /TAXON_ID=2988 /ORGANISM="Mallomonas Sp, Strain CCMP3275" /LENGTH=631 /DNA_ID=CAMNT_0024596389 /DNA_START=25 /DNA_END=1920 /DNA_ORIENTATION=+
MTLLLQPTLSFNGNWHRRFGVHSRPSLELSALSEDSMSEVLEEMIFSGDVEGFVRRRAKDVVQEEYVSFLNNKLTECDDDDEKTAISDVLAIIKEKMRVTEGLGENTGLVFESRLDKILFTNPSQRLEWMKENREELSEGFIEYVKEEMKNNDDADNKMVIASVLQLIGQVTNTDVLGSDTSLLDQSASLIGSDPKISDDVVMNRNEQILAGLMFSQGDLLEDVLNSIQYFDDAFVSFLQKRIDITQDIEERVGLKSLLDTITTVLERVREVQGDELDIRDTELSIDQVKQRVQEIQSGEYVERGEKQNYNAEFSVSSEKRDTFLSVLKRFENLPADVSLSQAVEENYALCDKQFIEQLDEEIRDCEREGAEIEAQQFREIRATISSAMATRIQAAQDKLAQILEKGKGRPGIAGIRAMESEIAVMARKNLLDEAVVLLMEANMQQAAEAGAKPVVDVFKQLLLRVQTERERRLPDEQRLLRQLLRLSDVEERKGLLFAAFKPSKTGNQEGEIVEGPPLVTPPSFIQLVRNFIQSFGNVDKFDIMGRAQAIIDEAQVVATELYGEGMTAREQQKLMFEKNTLSVWDLAKYEEEAMMLGEDVPWRNDAYDDKNPEDVIGERVRKIGGIDGGM